jgi:Tol biopolymer transport system component
VSADGQWVAYESAGSIYLHDRVTGTDTLVSVSTAGVPANLPSGNPSISGDGRFIAFASEADNLVPDDTNGFADIFVRDRLLGKTERVSVSATGQQANWSCWTPAISADGRFVAFGSAASLTPDKHNGAADVFVHDRQTGKTERVSVSATGGDPNDDSGDDPPAISADGRFVAFDSWANNLVPGDTNGWEDVFVRDRQTGKMERVSVSSAGTQGNFPSFRPVISADGSVVAYVSAASTLVPGNTSDATDVFLRDRATGKTERISVSSTGQQADNRGYDYELALSADGRLVAFSSSAANLVPGDTNSGFDVFLRDRSAGTTERLSVTATGLQVHGSSSTPAMSADGRVVTFQSDASDLIPGDPNDTTSVFVIERN